jgi:hypothetical protein
MITELDETIKQLLIKKGKLDHGEIDISFETPDREWSASISKPRVNLYLYDIRENHDLRGMEWQVSLDRNGRVARKKNPNRIDLSYLVTVWANDVGDEHRLLWHVLATLFRYPVLPDDVLPKSLVDQDYPITSITAQPDGLLQNPADFWTALDNNLKPAINYVVTVPLDLATEFTAPMVRTKEVRVSPPGGESEQWLQIAGQVMEAGKPEQPVPGAKIFAREAGISVESDGEGHYSFPRISAGTHTLQVTAPGRKARDFNVKVPGENYDLEA